MIDPLINVFTQFRGDVTTFAANLASNLSVVFVFIGAFCGALAIAGCIADYFGRDAHRD